MIEIEYTVRCDELGCMNWFCPSTGSWDRAEVYEALSKAKWIRFGNEVFCPNHGYVGGDL